MKMIASAAKQKNTLEKLAIVPSWCHHLALGNSGRGGTWPGERVIAVANSLPFLINVGLNKIGFAYRREF